MKNYCYLRVNANSSLFPMSSNDNGIWERAEEARQLMADMCCDAYGTHSARWYYDRCVFCTIEDGTHAVCCLANEGENHDMGTFNPLMDDGEEYLYFNKYGDPMLYNSSDEFGVSVYRVHKF